MICVLPCIVVVDFFLHFTQQFDEAKLLGFCLICSSGALLKCLVPERQDPHP